MAITLGKPVPTISIDVPQDKAAHLQQIGALSAETLRLLAELSKKPGIESTLKKNEFLLKTML